MTKTGEAQQVDQVVDRLSLTFSDIPRDRVAAIVAEEHEVFAGRPVRDYVPVLVERKVKQRLRVERELELTLVAG